MHSRRGAVDTDAMDMSRDAVAQRIREYYGRDALELMEPVAPPAARQLAGEVAELAKAFVLEVNGKTVVTGPARSAALPEWASLNGRSNPHYLYLQGALVGSGEPNRNGAYWSADDLAFGEPTVAHGPLNWLHEERHIIGAIHDSALIQPDSETEAAGITNPFIGVGAAVWRYIYGAEAEIIEQASDAGTSFLSMECVSEKIACLDHGCGTWAYDKAAEEACEHVKKREGARHLIDPTFLGAAVIIPPVRPGWAEAHMEVVRQAAMQAEHAFEVAGRPDVAASTWELIVARIYAQHS